MFAMTMPSPVTPKSSQTSFARTLAMFHSTASTSASGLTPFGGCGIAYVEFGRILTTSDRRASSSTSAPSPVTLHDVRDPVRRERRLARAQELPDAGLGLVGELALGVEHRLRALGARLAGLGGGHRGLAAELHEERGLRRLGQSLADPAVDLLRRRRRDAGGGCRENGCGGRARLREGAGEERREDRRGGSSQCGQTPMVEPCGHEGPLRRGSRSDRRAVLAPEQNVYT